MAKEQVFIGKIIKTEPIENADNIVQVTVVCGQGGKWRSVMRKMDLLVAQEEGRPMAVFLPDSILPATPEYDFLKSRGYKIKQSKFRGAVSECLVMPCSADFEIGTDVTEHYGVTKFEKQSGPTGVGTNFPDFIPRTDEPNAQRYPALLEALKGKPYVITLKMDGMSSTAYEFQGKYGVCSRNLELEPGIGYQWDVAPLAGKVPDGYAIQWETCGPNIQSNPLGLESRRGYCFNVWDIPNARYLDFEQADRIYDLVRHERLTTPRLIEIGSYFAHTLESLQELAAKLVYLPGVPAEGLVIRPQIEEQVFAHKEFRRLSFKVINLLYKGD